MKRSHYSPITNVNFLAKDKETGGFLIPDVLQIVEPEIIDLHPELGVGSYNVKLKNNIGL